MAEAQTLTYDANEQPEGELNAEEKEALEVGEKLADAQESLLAGKFKDAEDLEKGYIELQKKLGESKEETTEKEPEAKKEEEKTEEVDIAFLEKLMDSRQVAQMFLEYRSKNEPQEQTALTEDNISQLQGVAGGKEQYGQMMQWAGENLSENEVKMYDAVMDKGDPLAAFFAVQSLAYRFNDARGVDGQLLQGKAAPSKGDAFRSQAEVVRAMNDPRYDKDPAYRQDIYDKLERSNLKF